jgi:RHS repeat-associated protein
VKRTFLLFLFLFVTVPILAQEATYTLTLVSDAAPESAEVIEQLREYCRCTIERSGATITVHASRAEAHVLAGHPQVVSLTGIGTEAVTTTGWDTGLYTYDGAGNITGIGTDTYRYDRLNRLVSGTVRDGNNVQRTESYTYDRYGNLEAITRNGSVIDLAVDAATNQLRNEGGHPATYDLNGRVLTSSAGVEYTAFTYDGLDMVTSVAHGGITTVHVYSASDERIGSITVSAPGQPSDWTIRDTDGQVLRRFAKNGSTYRWAEDYIYRDGQLLAAELPEGRRVFHLDHLGTPRLITNGNGERVAFHSYYPFGFEATDVNQDAEKRQFTGHERDNRYLDYMRARYYNPNWGRFLSVDPVIDFKTNMTNPQGWNRYSYVRNNPVRWTDPTGKVIEYEESFRKRVRQDAVFHAAFEAWKKTPSGQKQWQMMARDKDTTYKLAVGDASYKPSLLSSAVRVNGRTGPDANYKSVVPENRWGQLNSSWTRSIIDADRMQEGPSSRTQARTIAGALFEEVAHALDLGSSSRTRAAALGADEQFHADPPTEPRLIRFLQQLNEVLPPEP